MFDSIIVDVSNIGDEKSDALADKGATGFGVYLLNQFVEDGYEG